MNKSVAGPTTKPTPQRGPITADFANRPSLQAACPPPSSKDLLHLPTPTKPTPAAGAAVVTGLSRPPEPEAPGQQTSEELLQALLDKRHMVSRPLAERLIHDAVAFLPAGVVALVAQLAPRMTMAAPLHFLPLAAEAHGRGFVEFWWQPTPHEPKARYAPGVNELGLESSLPGAGRKGATALVYGLMGALDYALGSDGLHLSSSTAWQQVYQHSQRIQRSPMQATSPREFFAKAATAYLSQQGAQHRGCQALSYDGPLLRERFVEAHTFMRDVFGRRLRHARQTGPQSPRALYDAEAAYLQQSLQRPPDHRNAESWLRIATAAYALSALQHDTRMLGLASQALEAYALCEQHDASAASRLKKAISRTRNFLAGPHRPSAQQQEYAVEQWDRAIQGFKVAQISEFFGLLPSDERALLQQPDDIQRLLTIMGEQRQERTDRIKAMVLRPGPSIGDRVEGVAGEVTDSSVINGHHHLRVKIVPPLFIYAEKRDKIVFNYPAFQQREADGGRYALHDANLLAESNLEDYVHSAFGILVKTPMHVDIGSHVEVAGTVTVVDGADKKVVLADTNVTPLPDTSATEAH